MVDKKLKMKRNIGFDIARCLSMFYVVGVLHLSEYTGSPIAEKPICVSLIWTALGVFTFLSAYLLASRYSFSSFSDVKLFYKKRLLRFYPLFFISSLALVLIGFNSWHETWKGLLGISPFWTPQQHTLWYIATLIFMYTVTPLLAVKNSVRSIIYFCLILIGCFAIDYLFHSVDSRFYYYFLVYELGILLAKKHQYLTKKVLSSKYLIIMIIPYILLLLGIGIIKNRILMFLGGYFGILIILNISLLIAKKWDTNKRFVSIVSFVSYGSMCAYLFHREIYWLFLTIWTPEEPLLIWAYLFFLAFPVTIFISYYIQNKYDKLF